MTCERMCRVRNAQSQPVALFVGGTHSHSFNYLIHRVVRVLAHLPPNFAPRGRSRDGCGRMSGDFLEDLGRSREASKSPGSQAQETLIEEDDDRLYEILRFGSVLRDDPHQSKRQSGDERLLEDLARSIMAQWRCATREYTNEQADLVGAFEMPGQFSRIDP